MSMRTLPKSNISYSPLLLSVRSDWAVIIIAISAALAVWGSGFGAVLMWRAVRSRNRNAIYLAVLAVATAVEIAAMLRFAWHIYRRLS